MKNKIKSLLPLLFLLPMIAYAKGADSSSYIFTIIWVSFATLHWTFGVFKPLGSKLDEKLNTKGLTWTLFFIRVFLLVICIPIYGESVIFVDFFALFALAFISSIIDGLSTIKQGVSSMSVVQPTVNNGTITCPKCGKEFAFGNTRCTFCGTDLTKQPLICPKCKTENLQTSRFCKSCGEPLETTPAAVFLGDKLSTPKECPKCKKELTEVAKFCKYCGENVESIMGKINLPIPKASIGNPVNRQSFDQSLLIGTESQAIQNIIKKEMSKDPNTKGKTLPTIERKKVIMTLIYVVIVFILLSIYMAYHTYMGLGIALILVASFIYLKVVTNYKIEKYIEKEVNKRPDEKISYITSSILSGSTTNRAASRLAIIIILIAAIGSFIFLFKEPHMIYENYAGGKALRYYTYGIFSNPKEITIPSQVKGDNVLSIRGDVFKNVKSIEKVVIPETVQEIRGGAFQNCTNLKNINLPEGLDEIHGDTFNGCTSLEAIVIPEGVTRIGGSAFRDCINLRNVTIPKSVEEIGSSAFRNTSIGNVCISNSTYVNERAFKGTYPTITYYENGCENTYEDDDYYDYNY